MADSLTLPIGVDTTALTAKLAQAQADVRAYAAEVRKLANQLRPGRQRCPRAGSRPSGRSFAESRLRS